LIVLGIAVLVFAGYLWQAHRDSLAYGMLIPLLIFGLAGIGGGAGLAYRTNRQIAELTNLYQVDKQAFAAQEEARMQKVNANWPRLKLSYAVIIFISLGLFFLVKKDWMTGLTLALILICSMLLIVDVFAEKRAIIYTEQIKLITS
jgi:predicted transporter